MDKKSIIEFINSSFTNERGRGNDYEEMLSNVVVKVREKYSIICDYIFVANFDGGPGYEANAYAVVFVLDGEIKSVPFLEEWY